MASYPPIFRTPIFIFGNPLKQDFMIHPKNANRDYPLIPNTLGIHGSLNPKGTLFITDIRDWPGKGPHSILLH